METIIKNPITFVKKIIEGTGLPVEMDTLDGGVLVADNNKKLYSCNGKVYQVVEDTDNNECYLAFICDSSFTLNVYDKIKHWDGKLEYTTDTKTWAEWDGTTVIESSARGFLGLRGIGNTVITGERSATSRFVLTSSKKDIHCVGNLETLLDYETVKNGGHPTLGAQAFSYLFYGSATLVTPPSMPFVEVSEYCCYNMLNNCKKIIGLPTFNVTKISNYGLCNMFNGCSSIKLSETQTDEYTIPYRIPMSGECDANTTSLVSMFTNTGGTFTGTPTKHTTYYLSNENAIVDESTTVRYTFKETAVPYPVYKGEFEVVEDAEIPTDLTGYKITIPAGWTVPAGYSEEIGVFESYNEYYYIPISGFFTDADNQRLMFDRLLLGYELGEYDESEDKENSILTIGDYTYKHNLSNETSIQFTFLQSEYNEGATNKQFIQWLADNNATFEKIEDDNVYFWVYGDTVWQAEKGTTWEQWINDNPDYTDYWTIGDDECIYTENTRWYVEKICYTMEGDTIVKVSDLIENRMYYVYGEDTLGGGL